MKPVIVDKVEQIVNMVANMLVENENTTNSNDVRRRQKQKIKVSVLDKCFIGGCVMLSCLSHHHDHFNNTS